MPLVGYEKNALWDNNCLLNNNGKRRLFLRSTRVCHDSSILVHYAYCYTYHLAERKFKSFWIRFSNICFRSFSFQTQRIIDISMGLALIFHYSRRLSNWRIAWTNIHKTSTHELGGIDNSVWILPKNFRDCLKTNLNWWIKAADRSSCVKILHSESWKHFCFQRSIKLLSKLYVSTSLSDRSSNESIKPTMAFHRNEFP